MGEQSNLMKEIEQKDQTAMTENHSVVMWIEKGKEMKEN